MISREKMKTMSQMALFENSKEGKKALKVMSFFRTDFIRWEILKTVVSVTLGYAIVLALIVLYNLEFIIKNATKLHYRGLGFRALGVYLVIIILYVSFTVMTATYRFGISRKMYKRYEQYLKKLAIYYDKKENIQEDSDDTASSSQGQD